MLENRQNLIREPPHGLAAELIFNRPIRQNTAVKLFSLPHIKAIFGRQVPLSDIGNKNIVQV